MATVSATIREQFHPVSLLRPPALLRLRRPVAVTAAAVTAAALTAALGVALLLLLVSPSTALAAPSPDWPTYHHDPARTGVSTDQDALGGVNLAWTSADIDGRLIYAQPLVVGDRVIVATEGNTVASLNAATGAVVWSRNLGTPVPRTDLPGGNIDPSGITGTPVIDVSTGTIYVVAFLRTGPHHELFALDLTTGAIKWQRAIDPPGLSPLVEQQRPALALTAGRVYVSYGGLSGDIGQYKGAVVSAAADGTGSLTSYIVPTTRMGGIWNPTGPVVDAAGDLWVITGNTASQTTFDYGNAVIRLSPALTVLDYFAPTNWASLNASDLDLNTLGPVLLPGGKVLAVGKTGVAYLLNAANLGHVSSAQATLNIGSRPFGTAAIIGSRVFIPCTGGLKALDVSGNTLSVAWTVTGGTASPIVAAGHVWTLGSTGILKGVDPVTGAVVYTRQLATPASRFITLSAAGGRLFVPDRTKIVALGLHGPPSIAAITPNAGSPDGGDTVTITGLGFTGATSVTFGGTPATLYTVNSPTRITATAPAHALGTVDVVVTTPWGPSDPAGTANDFIYTNRVEQTDARIVKSGTWSNYATTKASSGSYGRSSSSGASATIYFTGTRLDWIGMKGTTTGIADVYLDGHKVATIDLAATTATYQVNVWTTGDLPDGLHSVSIVRSSASATGKYVTLDAVDITGTISPPPTRYQQTDSRIVKVGAWADFAKTAASGGSYGRSNTTDASATIYFTGTRFDWIGMTGTTTGIADVYLDGNKVATIDLSAATATYQVNLWSSPTLAPGNHNVRIVRNGGSAAGKYITLDAVDIWGTILAPA